MNTPEQRRAPRKRPDARITVTDAITGQLLGHLGNLSSNGMLLIGQRVPRNDAIYQVNLPLHRHDGSVSTIEIGIQEQWHESAATPGQTWAGYRIIAISNAEAMQLDHWLQQA
ncbi:PilZ domain-containing protein [Dyella sp. M7H15-1]|uniref:PilZ domain-containing protein n=1 Tax=Dyella sp. M7H15-1 TaxID=2501295 RepID=UPI001004FBBD|nr:PilZ domain-containing protein [Dyella sp. M7H15-1]QAU24360.1 PilZ domain-containing protein [Dyella sp. M7H15-1]